MLADARKSLRMLLFLQLPTRQATFLSRCFRRARRSNDVRRILVVRLDGIGDVIMTLPLLSALRDTFPQAHITFAVPSVVEPLLRASPFFDETLALSPLKNRRFPLLLGKFVAARRFFRHFLRGRYFDLVINPRWDIDIYFSTYLCALARAPVCIGYEDSTSNEKKRWNRGFERGYTIVLPAGCLRHEVTRNLDVARALGCQVDRIEPSLAISKEQREKALDWLGRGSREVCVALGLPASEANRRWDAAHYIAVLERLEAGGPLILVLVTDPDTRATAEAIRCRFPGARSTLGQALPEVAAILSECRVFLGSDSGMGHIAAATGCKTVTLSPHPQSGESDHSNSPTRFRPFSSVAHVVQPRAPRDATCAAGCDKNVPHCILDIDPNEVAEILNRLLRGDP